MTANPVRSEPPSSELPGAGFRTLPEHADSELLTVEGNRITARKLVAGLGWDGGTELWAAPIAQGIWMLQTNRPRSGPRLPAKVSTNCAHIAFGRNTSRAVGLASGDKILMLTQPKGLTLVEINHLYMKEIE